jgi:hypothetical protein
MRIFLGCAVLALLAVTGLRVQPVEINAPVWIDMPAADPRIPKMVLPEINLGCKSDIWDNMQPTCDRRVQDVL